MDQQNLSALSCAQVSPTRRLVAAGFIRRLPGRTLTVRATQVGVTGTITPTLSAFVCCGRPMGPEGGQLVCSRCGAWVDPGAVPPQAQTIDDDSDDACPICCAWECRCGTSRSAALEAVAAR